MSDYNKNKLNSGGTSTESCNIDEGDGNSGTSTESCNIDEGDGNSGTSTESCNIDEYDRNNGTCVSKKLRLDDTVSSIPSTEIFSSTKCDYNGNMFCLKTVFSKNGYMVAISFFNLGFIDVRCTETGELLHRFPNAQHLGLEPSLLSFADNTKIILVYEDGYCVIWCFNTNLIMQFICADIDDEDSNDGNDSNDEDHSIGVNEIISILTSSDIVLFVSFCGEVIVFNILFGSFLCKISLNAIWDSDDNFILAIAISNNGARIYVVSYKSLSVYDSFTGELVNSYVFNTSAFSYTPDPDEIGEIYHGPIAVSGDNKSLVFAFNGNIFIVSLKEDSSDSCSKSDELDVLMLDIGNDNHTCEVSCITISSDCKTLVAVSGNSVKLYTIGETTVYTGGYLKSSILAAAITDDSNTVISFSDTGVIARFEMNALRKWSLYLYHVMAIPINVIYTILSMLGFNTDMFKEDFWYCAEKN
jgi:hypothetical protein